MADDAAAKAAAFEAAGKLDAAIYFYTEGAESLLSEIRAGRASPSLRPRAEWLIDKAEALKLQQSARNREGSGKSATALGTERAEFLLYQALGEDEAGKAAEASALYMEAVELCLTLRKQSNNDALNRKLKILAEKALERAEVIKVASKPLELPSPPRDNLQAEEGLANLSLDPSPRPARKAAGLNPSTLTKEELGVLRTTSTINGREYLPFMAVDLRERFGFPVPFSDKDGLLALSQKQRARFARWVRPEDYLSEPKLIDRIDSGTIKQTVVSDCSFVASLAITARYERRTGKRLITRIIYPQNKAGEPVYNPCGKYMVRFELNGVGRKVIIDDRLPMGAHGDLLCSYSQNRNELWVSLLEKAYLKVMGGYDFPGSSSNIDLHAMTGWIPERVAMKGGSAGAAFDAEATFAKILAKYHAGDCLVTVATGKLSPEDCERAGLVECHAYAMLDARREGGRRLFQLKNPWNHLRWKGKYSERDTSSWTPELRAALNYDPDASAQTLINWQIPAPCHIAHHNRNNELHEMTFEFDDGVFWIDMESLCHFFDVFYINWNPALFAYTYAIHSSWHSGLGPVKDLYSIAANPQFCLELVPTAQPVPVWILLTRHITDKADFADNKEYISVLVYKNEGKRVYYPFDPPPWKDGTRINSPHYLCKMILPAATAAQRLSLVVVQYEKLNTINYTLRVYSSQQFRLTKLRDAWRHAKKETGEWKGKTAGGCPNHGSSYVANPAYKLTVDEDSNANGLLLELKGPKQYSVGLSLTLLEPRYPGAGADFGTKSSGAYRPGYCMLRLDEIPAGTYRIVPSTFLPGQEGPFILDIASTANLKLSLFKEP